MIFIFTLSGVLWGLLGLAIGAAILFLTTSPGAALLAMGIFWIIFGRKKKKADGQVVAAPRLYFLPLFVYGVAALIFAPIFFWAEWSNKSTPTDQRSVLLRHDMEDLDIQATGGIEPLSKLLKGYMEITFKEEAEPQTWSYFTKINDDKLLVLIKIPKLSTTEAQSRRVLFEAVAECLKDNEEYKDKQLYLGIQGRILLGALKTPEHEEIQAPIHNKYLYPFYAPEPIFAEGVKTK